MQLTVLCVLAACENNPPLLEAVIVGTISISESVPAVSRLNQTHMLDTEARIYEGNIITADDVPSVNIKMIDGSAPQPGTIWSQRRRKKAQSNTMFSPLP